MSTLLGIGHTDERRTDPGDDYTGLIGTGKDVRLDDWAAWLDLSATPPVVSRPCTARLLYVRGGRIEDPRAWPTEAECRIYVAYDQTGPVYVGQTTRILLSRVRNHFANQRSDVQQRKAGTWQFLVSAAFDDLRLGDLDRLERSAADWLLPIRHRLGRRHPRPGA